MNSFGERMKQRRKELSLTLEQVGDVVGVGKSTVRKWEDGIIANMRRDKIEKLAKALHLEPGVLMGWQTQDQLADIHDITDAGLRIGRLYDRADDRAREIVGFTLKPFDDGTLKKGTAHGDNFEIAAEITPVFTRPIPLHRLPVSAGTGEFLDSDDFDIIEAGPEAPSSATFGVRISGDSMEPVYPNGYVAWVKRAVRVDEGQVGVFVLNGDGFIKKLGRKCLLSLNPDYQPITLNEEDELRTFGIVVGVSENVY